MPVEHLKPGMRFRLHRELGGTALVTGVSKPKAGSPLSDETDFFGNSLRDVLGTVKYTGRFRRLDFGVRGDVIRTTPGHKFWSETRQAWIAAEAFQVGELLRNRQGLRSP